MKKYHLFIASYVHKEYKEIIASHYEYGSGGRIVFFDSNSREICSFPTSWVEISKIEYL